MKKKFKIIYWRFYSFDGKTKLIGGVETYILNLAKLTTNLGYDTFIYQCANIDFINKTENYTALGFKTPNVKIGNNKSLKILYNKAIENIDKNTDIILFGTDEWSLSNVKCKNISIQHGIGWDKPIELMTDRPVLMKGLGETLKRYKLRRKSIKDFNKSTYKVCVDYNFLNWYRTFQNSAQKNIHVIPNFASHLPYFEIQNKLKLSNSKKNIKVLFARRFEIFRGTRLMIDTIKEISELYNDVEFTLAGYGSDSNFLKNSLEQYKNVKFIQYSSEEALQINYEHDIAVIPSIGSEGTSFSVAEAMGAGAAVIATNSGGITNMILNNYNGLLINPDSFEIINAIIKLRSDRKLRIKIAERAYETASTVFSRHNWEVSWTEFLNQIQSVKSNNL